MNLKSEAQLAIETRRERLLKQLAELDKYSELAEKLPEDYPIPFSACVCDSSFSLSTWQQGASRDLAAVLSAELEIKFSKHFYEQWGDWDFLASWEGLCIRVSSKPPASCNMRRVTKEATMYEIECEEGVA